jgi:hypothetical protein
LSASYLILLGREVDWGVPAEQTVLLASSKEAPTLPMEQSLESLGLCAGDRSAPERILLLRCASGESAWRAQVRMELAEIGGASICELPVRLLSSRELPFKGIIVREGSRPMLVLDSEALARRALKPQETEREG